MAKKLFNFNAANYLEIIKQGYSLDHIYILQLLSEGNDVKNIDSDKIKGLLQSLCRKQLLSDDLKLTEQGKQLLEQCSANKRISLKKLNNTDDFEKWWLCYPSSNCFTYQGKFFEGTQTKRQKRADCEMLFSKLINSGYKAEDIIGATQFHISMAKQMSFKRKENQLTYIVNSERYLREKSFEPYIVMYKTGIKTEDKPLNMDTVI